MLSPEFAKYFSSISCPHCKKNFFALVTITRPIVELKEIMTEEQVAVLKEQARSLANHILDEKEKADFLARINDPEFILTEEDLNNLITEIGAV